MKIVQREAKYAIIIENIIITNGLVKFLGGKVNNIASKQEEVRINFLKKQVEKEYYLQEFKEKIMISLSKGEVESGYVYPEIIEALHEPDADSLKMRRDIDFKFLKPYIGVADKLGLRYTLIDSDAVLGDVGIVVVSKIELDNEHEDLELNNIGEEFKKKGLKPYYPKSIGKKICRKHYKLIEEKFPVYKGSFKKFGISDVLFGTVCPICEEEKKEKSNGRSI